MTKEIVPVDQAIQESDDRDQLVPEGYFADDVELVERFQALEPGTYWRADKDVSIPQENRGFSFSVKAGTVLLLVAIDDYDGKPHTVQVMGHPQQGGGNFKALIHDFLNAFSPSYDAEEVRAKELANIQNKIQHLQAQLVEATTNPEIMQESVDAELRNLDQKFLYEDRREQGDIPLDQVKVTLPALPGGKLTTSVSSAIENRLSHEDVKAMRRYAERESAIAKGRVEWMERQTRKISDTLQQMAPFLKEKTAVALARASGAISFAKKIGEGIKSLDLYTGEGVEVESLLDGDEAHPSEKLHIFQRKLIVAEELAVMMDVGPRFDISSQDDFNRALAEHPAFLDQLIPAQRGVVSLALCRRDIDYGDSRLNAVMNEANKRVFLLVRNGLKVHKVYSSIGSHENTPRLFPETNELNEVFRGIDGMSINFDSLQFTEKVSKAERIALHYKRFLILLCGLDHRMNLFGRFYDEAASLSFISLPFQERYMTFVRDDDMGFMLGEGKPTVNEYIKEMNKGMQSGSRVFCYHPSLLTPESAPGMMRRFDSRGYSSVETYANSVNEAEELIAFKDGANLAVNVKAVRTSYASRGSVFNAKVILNDSEDGFLCLDRVTPEELEYYIYNREARIGHVNYLRNFKRIAAFLKEERASEAGAREYLRNSIVDAGLASREVAETLVNDSIISWRCTNRGAPLPSLADKASLNKILTHSYTLLKNNESLVARAEEYAEQQGLKLLRVAITGRSRLVMYVETPAEERDDTFMDWGWVHRISLDVLKTKLTETSSRPIWLTGKPDPRETVLKDWPAFDAWVQPKDEPISASTFKEIRQILDDSSDTLSMITSNGKGGGIPTEIYPELFRTIEYEMFTKAKRFIEPCNLAFPVASFLNFKGGRATPMFLCVSVHAHQLVGEFGSEEQKRALMDRFLRAYARPDRARQIATQPIHFDVFAIEGKGGLKPYAVNPSFAGGNYLIAAATYKLNDEWRPGEKVYTQETRGFDEMIAELVRISTGEAVAYLANNWYSTGERKVNQNTKLLVSPKLLDEDGKPILEKILHIEGTPAPGSKPKI